MNFMYMQVFNSLLPLICVLLLGYLTKRIILSLCAGIMLGALIASNFQPTTSIIIIMQCLWHNLQIDNFFSLDRFWEAWNFFICIFLLILGIFVCLLQQSGGINAYGDFIKKWMTNRKSAESASLILSMLLFIDDYFSCLTVGSVMYPLTDAHKVPRAKLAFLVDSMAAPLAILCPFSSWVAATLSLLKENGIQEDLNAQTLIQTKPLFVYFNLLPYLFYSIILIFSCWYIVRARIQFGPMKLHEDIAKQTGQLFGGNTHDEKKFLKTTKELPTSTIKDFLIPVAILLFSIIISMLYSGNWVLMGGNFSWIQALQNSSVAKALFLGGILALVFVTIYLLVRKLVHIKQLPYIYFFGTQMILPAVIVLMLAWSLGDLLRNQLHTGEYLANAVLSNMPLTLLPMILFFLSTFIAFAIGSSWGTAAIMFPIVIPMTLNILKIQGVAQISNIPILFPVLGAVLSGCVAGDHISPISDTTVMTATSTCTSHMIHVQTQLLYAIPVIIATGIAFWPATILQIHQQYLSSIAVGLITGIFISYLFLKRLNQKKRFCNK